MPDRRDANEREIISALVAAGAFVIQMSRSAGFDLVVCHSGRVYIVEVKSATGKLTKAEADTKAAVEAAGCVYWIIRSVEDALEMIGLHWVINRIDYGNPPVGKIVGVIRDGGKGKPFIFIDDEASHD